MNRKKVRREQATTRNGQGGTATIKQVPERTSKGVPNQKWNISRLFEVWKIVIKCMWNLYTAPLIVPNWNK